MTPKYRPKKLKVLIKLSKLVEKWNKKDLQENKFYLINLIQIYWINKFYSF